MGGVRSARRSRLWRVNAIIDARVRRTARIFLENNFLSTEIRIPITLVGTNSARAVGTNAMRGQVWDNFSSEDYKNLPAVGDVHFFNPYSNAAVDAWGNNDSYCPPAGGPGYLPTGLADQPVGDGALPAQQLVRPVQPRPLDRGAPDGLRRRHRQAAFHGLAFVIDAEGVVRYAHRAVAGLTFRSTDELVARREVGELGVGPRTVRLLLVGDAEETSSRH